uniref:HX=C3 homolog n=1 Tax=Eptatretus burgeri TaxID=7764 RepID=Q9TWX9_EPTBU|nr:HX=C3 homolog [Eptatretus burgeri=hagfish, serum, Peptide Partial, 10 aa] [Eptatretus burgeri]
SKVLVIAPAA